ncbi:MAG TPA: hypothetical protein VH518_22805 [Tepidisphaeraceae bacterium]|jgi:ElaB/YqjD/DUF883 family membrane-anchored ribosome-binding protein
MPSTAKRDVDEAASSSGVSAELESVKEGFVQLRQDVIDLFSQAFGLGRSKAYAAKQSAADAVDSLKERLAGLKDRGAEQLETVEKKIEDNPLPAALIAFGVGFVLAKILTRR